LSTMKKILVTGATGFIGNYVIDALLKKGCSIVATSSNESKAANAVWFKQVQYIAFDLRKFNGSINYQHFFGNPDAVIHLAWEGLPNYKAAFHTEENLPRHLAFIKNLVENGQQDISITGTCFEYGMQEGCLSEDMPAMPANAYSLAKDSLRRQLEHLQQQNSFHLKWIRLFYMYGAGQNPNSLLSQLDRALEHGDALFNMSGGEQVRDYLPVEKVAEYIACIALQNEVGGIINCCSGIPVTVKSLVKNYLKEKKQTIALNLGYYPYADYEPMRFWGSTDRLNLICR
jgi:nucleoside-diphosphate-sugar epimerase